VSSSDTDGTVPADFEFGTSEFCEPTLRVEAAYIGGLRVPSQQVIVGNYGPNLNVQFFRGPEARLYFAVQAGPINLLKVRILWTRPDNEWQHTDVYATNILNGIAPVPLDVYSDGRAGFLSGSCSVYCVQWRQYTRPTILVTAAVRALNSQPPWLAIII
jgi:hypothetical protein